MSMRENDTKIVLNKWEYMNIAYFFCNLPGTIKENE